MRCSPPRGPAVDGTPVHGTCCGGHVSIDRSQPSLGTLNSTTAGTYYVVCIVDRSPGTSNKPSLQDAGQAGKLPHGSWQQVILHLAKAVLDARDKLIQLSCCLYGHSFTATNPVARPALMETGNDLSVLFRLEAPVATHRGP